MVHVPADRSGIRLDDHEFQAAPTEHRGVGLAHAVVRDGELRLIGMEAVPVLHQELARAHDAEARADLISEFGLNLVQIQRQIAIGADVVSHEIRDRFLVSGSENVLSIVPILLSKKLLPILLPAAGLLPKLGRHEDREKELLASRPVHFLTNDLGHLARNAPSKRQDGVDAGRELAQHSRPNHQLVADQLGVGRIFLERGNEGLRLAHARCVRPRLGNGEGLLERVEPGRLAM